MLYFCLMKTGRIKSIDALRGLVMILMLVDHARESFYMHAQVSDPVDLSTTSTELFFTRLTAHLCAPVFVFLTGLSAWLYSRAHSLKDTSEFLLKRGFFLIFLELTLISFGWTFSFQPELYFLQVIWAIGLSMIFLSALIWPPRYSLIILSFAIIFGHNLLDPISFLPTETGHTLWAIIHDRSIIELPWGIRARTSYPVLPWIGVIGLGYLVGPWFSQVVTIEERSRRLLIAGGLSLGSFLLLRSFNIYGESMPWVKGSFESSVMSFLNLTKYPPSVLFLLFTLGVGFLLLMILEKVNSKVSDVLSTFGSAPMFFYIVHIYVLNLLNRFFLFLLGPNEGVYFSVSSVGQLWLIAGLLSVPLWFSCRWFGRIKRSSNSPILKYF